jgi:hypothetical protein
MGIEFNTSRIPKPEYAEPAAHPRAVPSGQQAEPLPNATGLEKQLNAIPLVRPEQVNRAKALVANEKYPPDDVLDRIAILLANLI